MDDEDRVFGVFGHARFDNLCVRNIDRAADVTPCVKLGNAYVDEYEVSAPGHRVLNVPAVGFQFQARLEVRECDCAVCGRDLCNGSRHGHDARGQ